MSPSPCYRGECHALVGGTELQSTLVAVRTVLLNPTGAVRLYASRRPGSATAPAGKSVWLACTTLDGHRLLSRRRNFPQPQRQVASSLAGVCAGMRGNFCLESDGVRRTTSTSLPSSRRPSRSKNPRDRARASGSARASCILDEPTASLESHGNRAAFDRVRRVKASGVRDPLHLSSLITRGGLMLDLR